MIEHVSTDFFQLFVGAIVKIFVLVTGYKNQAVDSVIITTWFSYYSMNFEKDLSSFEIMTLIDDQFETTKAEHCCKQINIWCLRKSTGYKVLSDLQ